MDILQEPQQGVLTGTSDSKSVGTSVDSCAAFPVSKVHSMAQMYKNSEKNKSGNLKVLDTLCQGESLSGRKDEETALRGIEPLFPR